jgi:GAF domain-containing protein
VKRGIAGQAATAIDNARLFQAAEDGDLNTDNGLIKSYCKRPSDLF